MNLRNRQLIDVYRLNLDDRRPDARHRESRRRRRLGHRREVPGPRRAGRRRRTAAPRSASATTRSRRGRRFVKVGPEEILDFEDFTPDGKSAYLEVLGRQRHGAPRRARPRDRRREGARRPRRRSTPATSSSTRRRTSSRRCPSRPAAPRGRSSTRPSRRTSTRIAKLNAGDFTVVNRTDGRRPWLVAFTSDRGPVSWYTWDRAAKKGTFLFTAQPKLEGLPLAEMKPVVDQDARRPDAELLPDAARRRRAEEPADGALRPRRPVGARHLGLQPVRRSGSPTAATPSSR